MRTLPNTKPWSNAMALQPYCALLGELLDAYVTCRPDIGYDVNTPSKFATKPGDYHFSVLKHIVKYLRRTKDWGLHFVRSTPDAAKHAKYLRAVLSEQGFPQSNSTVIYCNNKSAINTINACHPTECSRHILIQFFAIQYWKESGEIVLRHIPGISNPTNDLTKPLGWVLHARHAHCLMGHYHPSLSTQVDPCPQQSREAGC